MLQRLNSNIKGWVAGVIFTVISSTFVLWGVQYYMQAKETAEQVAATVDGQNIGINFINRQFQQYQMNSGFVQSPEERLQIKNAILSQAISKVVQNQVAGSIGFKGGAPELIQSLIVGSFATPSEVSQLSRDVVEHNSFEYLVVPAERYQGVGAPDESVIKSYYQKHKSDFLSPARLKCQYIQLSPSDIEKTITVTSDEIRNYYEENAQSYFVPRSWEVQRLVVPVAEGANDLAVKKKSLSLIKKLKSVNDIGDLLKKNPLWHLANQKIPDVGLPARLVSVLSTLKPGQVSAPIQTAEGLNVFKLVQYHAASQTPLSQVREKIKKIIFSQRLSAKFSELNQSLSDQTYTKPDSLQPAADSLKLKVKTSDWFTEQQGSGVFSSQRIRALAFSRDVLESKNNSRVVTLNNGDSIVIRVIAHEPSHAKSLSEVKSNIISILEHKKSVARAGARILKIANEIKQGQNATVTALKNGLTWKRFSNKGSATSLLLQLALIKRYNLPVTGLTYAKVGSKSAPPLEVFQALFQSSTAGFNLGFAHLKNGDSVLTRLLPVSPESKNVVPDQKVIARTIGQWYAEMYFKSFVDRKLSFAKIKRFPDVLKSSV